MEKRVLITGGTGFIGQHTLDPLLFKNFEVHVTTSKPDWIQKKNIFFHQTDLLNCQDHIALIKKICPTHLLHTAWFTTHGQFWESVENVNWLKATISLADTFFSEGGTRFLGLGTCAEYDWEDGLCIPHQTKENPASLYGKVKKAAYECLSSLAKAHHASFIWARIFFPYGPHESEKRLIPYVIRQLLQNKEAHCTHGMQIRDFLHVYDMAEAIVSLLDSNMTGIVNIGSGEPVYIHEVVSRIGEQLNKSHLIKLGSIKEPTFSAKKIVADITHLKSTGWFSKYSLEKGLQQVIHWWRETDTIQI